MYRARTREGRDRLRCLGYLCYLLPISEQGDDDAEEEE